MSHDQGELFCLFLKVMGTSNLEIHFTKFQKIKSFILEVFQVTLTIRVLPGSKDPPRKRSPGTPVGSLRVTGMRRFMILEQNVDVSNFTYIQRCRQSELNIYCTYQWRNIAIIVVICHK